MEAEIASRLLCLAAAASRRKASAVENVKSEDKGRKQQWYCAHTSAACQ